LLLTDVGLAALVGIDLIRALRSGRARGRGGTITREGRPKKFRRYIYADWALLAACAGVLVWILIAPETP